MKRSPGRKTALAVLFWVAVAGIAAHAEAQLPEGSGRSLVLEACVQCHDVEPIVSQRKTAEGWRRSVSEMVWRGAQLVGDEPDVLTRYLAASFGPDAPPVQPLPSPGRAADVDAQLLPPGDGRELVLSACVACHDLEPIVTVRRSEADWQRSIAQMIQLGVNLMGDEVQLLTQYLTDAFGSGQD